MGILKELLYHDIKNIFKEIGGFDNVEFYIPKSEYVYVTIYDKVNRFSHGDHFRYSGGIGGVQIPMMKWVYRINQIKHADMSFIGHWHQNDLRPSSNCMVNGSVIGYGPYAYGISAPYEPPAQKLQLLDSKYGYTVTEPIILI